MSFTAVVNADSGPSIAPAGGALQATGHKQRIAVRVQSEAPVYL